MRVFFILSILLMIFVYFTLHFEGDQSFNRNHVSRGSTQVRFMDSIGKEKDLDKTIEEFSKIAKDNFKKLEKAEIKEKKKFFADFENVEIDTKTTILKTVKGVTSVGVSPSYKGHLRSAQEEMAMFKDKQIQDENKFLKKNEKVIEQMKSYYGNKNLLNSDQNNK